MTKLFFRSLSGLHLVLVITLISLSACRGGGDLQNQILHSSENGETPPSGDEGLPAIPNEAPQPLSTTLNVTEDITATDTLLASDADGNALTYSVVTNGSKGTVTIINANTGAFQYVPNANQNGSDSFTYKINDGTVDSSVATVSVTIAAVADNPVASSATLNGTEDVTATGTLSASDGDGDALTYSLVANGTKGTATITNAATGAFQYVPMANQNGADSFTFRVNDGTANSNTATISVNLASVNDSPVSSNGTLSVTEDTTATGTLVASDADGNALTYSIVANGTKGTATITNAATGAFQYVPAANQNGADSFTFRVNDGTVNSNTATISVTISAVADNPIASNGTLTVTEDVTATGTLVGSDADGDALTYSIVANGSKGTATITNAATGAFQYVPAANQNGSDSFTFKVNDGSADSNTATVSVTITAVNDTPVASNGTLNVTEDVTATGTLVATDADGNALTYSIVANGSKGTATITNAATGAFQYVPTANQNGADSFTFQVNDGTVNSNTATISVTIAAVNDTPVASNGTLNVTEDVTATGTLSASDADGDTLTYSIVANGSKGTATITNAATGAFQYVPAANQNGSDSFTFKVNDGTADSNTATISVTIAAVNDTPVASNGTLNVTEDVTATGTLSASDADGDTLTYSIVANGSKGTATITNAATGAFQYVPAANQNGSDSFTFKVNDGTADSNTATISVTIAAVNDTPVASNATLNVTEDVTATGTLSASDADGDTLTYSIVANGSKGTATITNATTGAFQYVPTADQNGSDSFTFKVNDGTVDSNTATISVTIAAVQDTAVASNGTLNATEDTTATGTLSASDVDGDTLTYSIVTNGSKGTATITNTATGAYSYVPSANQNGADSFTFKVNDGTADSNTATISVTIAAVNDAPVAVNDSVTTSANLGASVKVLRNDTDVEGSTLSVSAITQGTSGTVTAYSNYVTYVPNANYTGSDSFTYTVSDGSATAVGTVNVTVETATTTLIATGASWKYLDNGTDQGTAWKATGFNDTAWASGNAELGYGDSDEATVVSYGGNASNKYVTTYFRKSFNVADASIYSSLTLNLLRDDGAVVYLNGTEIERSNMPAGGITYTTGASSSVSGAGETTYLTSTELSSNLVTGTNVIAVEVHQDVVTSSDISFNLSLVGTVGTSSTILAASGSWKYLSNGSDEGTAWRASGFDDSAWSTGNAELGYGDGDEATVISYGADPNNKYPTAYFRKSVSIADPTIFKYLKLRVIRDDGIVVYVNGQEAYRDSMPSGTISYSTLASAAIGAPDESTYHEIALDKNYFSAGTNVIAVEVHQQVLNSSDVSFNLELLGLQ